MDVIVYYFITALLTLVCSIIYFWKWRRSFELCYTIVYMLIPFVNVGYLLAAVSKDLGEAITATKITYLGGCYLMMLIMISIFTLCQIKLPRWAVFTAMAVSTSVYISVLTIGHSDVFYKDVSMVVEDGVSVLKKSYGPMHSVFYALLFAYFGLSIAAIIYGFAAKTEASRKNIIMLSATQAFGLFAFFIGRAITDRIEWTPMAYVFDAIVYLFIIDRLALYDVRSTIKESMAERNENGFLALDLKLNLLGSNEYAKTVFPDLIYAMVDRPVPEGSLSKHLQIWINDFKRDEVTRDRTFKEYDRVFKVRVSYLMDRNRKRGYQIDIFDDTEMQDFLNSISDYNKKLLNENLAKDKMIEDLVREKKN
ncbi:N-terminal 7TM region of histidine kinase [Lachnospiraceae bacterium G11]|nr:N-terminal 7TM region of histidine kinase [Lachnospiraceae bacterium G11]